VGESYQRREAFVTANCAKLEWAGAVTNSEHVPSLARRAKSELQPTINAGGTLAPGLWISCCCSEFVTAGTGCFLHFPNPSGAASFSVHPKT
jgi:hypothetical protein